MFMVNSYLMPRRYRVVVLLVLPLAILFWLIGWSLYMAGFKQRIGKPKPISDQNGLKFTVLVPEKKIAT